MTYFEEQRFDLSMLGALAIFIIFLAIIISVFLMKNDQIKGFFIISSMIFPLSLLYFLFKLETKVTEEEIHLRFFPLSTIIISRTDIKQVEAIEYRPLRDFGGWGVRYGLGGKIYSVRGNIAVKVRLMNGDIVFIGTENSESLLKSLSPIT